jgi:hypothetical protein
MIVRPPNYVEHMFSCYLEELPIHAVGQENTEFKQFTQIWKQSDQNSANSVGSTGAHIIRLNPTIYCVVRHHGLNLSTMSTTTKAKSEPMADLNPRSTTYEFMGPPGAFVISLGVPFITYLLYFGCSEESGGCPPPLQSVPDRFVEALSDKTFWASLWDTEASLIYLGWYAFCVVAWAVLPGDWIEGVTMRTGEKKKYKINGSCLTMAANIDTDAVLMLCSFFDIPPCNGNLLWLYLSQRPRVLHLPLPKMDRIRHCFACHVFGADLLRVRKFIPPGRSSRTWWQLGKFHL